MDAKVEASAVDRKLFLGGSDIGAIIGVSKWRTPLDVFLEKTGQAPREEPDPKRAKILQRGRRMEPVVLEMLVDEHGYEITARNQRYTAPEHGFMACEIDAETSIDDEPTNIEIKTSHPFAADQWGEEGTDEIDVSYAAQAHWGLMITGRRRCIFAVLVGSDNLLTYEVIRDEEIIAGMRAKAVKFWQDTQAGIEPAPLNLTDVNRLFKRGTETKIEATPEIAGYVTELMAAGDRARAAAEAQDEMKFKIGCFMLGAEQIETPTKPGKHVLTLGGAELLTVTLQHQTRIDNEKLKLKFPEAVEECAKRTSFFVYRVKKGKS